MKQFLVLILGVLAAVVMPLPALANGDDLHLGGVSTGVPPVIAWIGGGGIAVVFLLLFIGWVVSRRRLQRGGPKETNGRGKEEHDDA